ncbi:hypothetical protein RN001_010285 [Aquatica leii]|uniref:Uncharacterized protein n=1 Tax=Aquatica leii TaxID=1421715 RepID=A0AAN7P687_9COLE|nr:hypothetical protein RN001_010285 [Aquatica leii]
MFSVISVKSEKKLPSNFQRCTHSDVGFNECLRVAMEDAIKKLAKGNKQLHIPPLEPIYIPSATIKEGSGAVHVVQKYTDLKIHGISSSTITKVVTAHRKDKIEIIANVTAPQYVLDANYDFDGQLLVFPIVGVGKSKITLFNVRSDWTFSGEYDMKNNQPFLTIKTFQVSLNPDKVNYVFENLFNGNEALSNQIHTVLNENWKDVFEDVKQGYEELIGTVCKSVANQIFTKIPANKIFL